MTSRIIGRFVLAVEVADAGAVRPRPALQIEANLVVPDETRAECAVLKAVANQFVVTTDSQMVLKAQQREVLAELVDLYAAEPDSRLDADFRPDFLAATDDGETAGHRGPGRVADGRARALPALAVGRVDGPTVTT